jgi:hypothetical protein
VKVIQYIAAGVVGALVAGVAVYRLAPRVEVVERVREVRVTVPAEPVPGLTPEDVARLTNEKAALQARLAEAEATVVLKDGALKQTKEQLAELRRPMEEDLMSSALKAELKSGEVVVTGGYRLPDGKRLYAFAQPVVETVDGESVVKIGLRIFKMTDAMGSSVGLDTLSTNAANTLQHGEVWVADEYADVVQKLERKPGMEGVTFSQDMAIVPGTSGIIETDTLKIRVTPTLTGGRDQMAMELRLEQPQKPTVAEQAQAPASQPEISR